jgi:hypothetical protein
MRLAVVSIDGGPATTASAGDPVPPGVRWASGNDATGYVVTVGDRGRLYTSMPASAGSGPIWREIVPRGADGGRIAAIPSFAVLSPDHRQVAALTGQPATGVADARLLVIDRSTGLTRVVALGGIVDGRPPVWIGDTRVAVLLRDDSDAPVLALVDTTTGSLARSAGTRGCLAASGDGATVVITDPTQTGTVATGAAAVFLSGGSLVGIPLDARPQTAGPSLAAQILLDRDGTTMAVVWLDDAGDAASVDIYRRAGDHWAQTRRLPLASDDTRAVLVGFDP